MFRSVGVLFVSTLAGVALVFGTTLNKQRHGRGAAGNVDVAVLVPGFGRSLGCNILPLITRACIVPRSNTSRAVITAWPAGSARYSVV